MNTQEELQKEVVSLEQIAAQTGIDITLVRFASRLLREAGKDQEEIFGILEGFMSDYVEDA